MTTEPTPTHEQPAASAPKKKNLLPVVAAGVVVLGGAAFALLGGNIEGDLKEQFAKKYDHPLCLAISSGYPFRARGIDAKRIDIIADQGYLKREDAPPNPYEFGMMGNAYIYDLTPEGKAKINDKGEFCYGTAKVTEIVDYTEPTESGGKESLNAEALVEYDVTEEWAEHEAFKNITRTGDDTVKAHFVKKRKAGWVIEDYGW